ncbi:MAG: cache domain-containing protein [Desulfomonilia bacterium]
MDKRTLTIIGVITVILVTTNLYAATCTKSDLIKSVDYAVGLINSKGNAALPELTKYRYCNGEGYVFVVEIDGKTILQPANPQLEGKDISVLQGAKGEYFGAEMKAKAQKYGEGWVSYVWENPKTKRLEIKCSFVKAATMDGKKVFVGSGIYGIPSDDCK